MAKQWYVIHVFSGYENRVKEALENCIESDEALREKIGRIFIPTEEVAEIKDGRKNITTKKVFPGYILLEMELDDSLWYMIRETHGVTGFVGPGRTPVPIPQHEVDAIMQKMAETGDRPRPKISFEVMSKVRIIEGPFQNFTGHISHIDNERGRLTIMVEILGRSTPVELDFLQVEKI